jgi:hypothetical protein
MGHKKVLKCETLWLSSARSQRFGTTPPYPEISNQMVMHNILYSDGSFGISTLVKAHSVSDIMGWCTVQYLIPSGKRQPPTWSFSCSGNRTSIELETSTDS